MKQKIIALLLLMLITGISQADQTLEEILIQGEEKAQTCIACHGKDGNSAIPNYPKLAGQNVKYLIKQLKEIKDGTRSAPLMTGMLDNFSDEDMNAVATYFANQQGTIGQAKKELVELGERIYRTGSPEAGIAACTACHSPTGSGNAAAGFPRLGGQHADYTAAQLNAFRTKKRTDSPIMTNIAERMSDEEINAVSSYISGLH